MSWEEPYAEKIDAIRRREIAFFRKTAFINCSNFTIAMMTPVIRTISQGSAGCSGCVAQMISRNVRAGRC